MIARLVSILSRFAAPMEAAGIVATLSVAGA